MTDPIRAQPEPAGLSDEKLMELMPQQFRDDLAAAVRAMAEQADIDSTRAKGVMRIILNRHVVDFARAAIAADRAQRQPVPPEQGEVQELVRVLHQAADNDEWDGASPEWCASLTRAADLLAQRYPQPVPVSEWRTIDTAPKDGTEILASDYDAVEILSWRKGRFELGIPGEWISRDGQAFFPAWWQPLAGHPALPLPVEVEG